MDGRATILRALPGLQEEPVDVLLALGQRFEVSLLRDAWVCRQGDPSDALYVIAEGYLGVYRGGRRLTVLGPGSVVGHVGAFSGAPRSAGLRAEGAAALMVMSAVVAAEILEAEVSAPASALRRALIVSVGRQIREASRALVRLSRQAEDVDVEAALEEARGLP